MKFFPEFEEVKKIAADGKYRVLPVSCEMLSDFTTPIETMKILKNVSTHCYMLESAMANEAGTHLWDMSRKWRSPAGMVK